VEEFGEEFAPEREFARDFTRVDFVVTMGDVHRFIFARWDEVA